MGKVVTAMLLVLGAATVACTATYGEERRSVSSAGGREADDDDGDPRSSSSLEAGTSSPDGGSATDATPDVEVEPPKVTILIDSKPFDVTAIEMFGQAPQHLIMKGTGVGAPVGSDIIVSATEPGTGCVNTANYITYRPEGDTQFMPNSTVEPSCGLTITELPKISGRYKGTFRGTLRSINVTPVRTKQFQISFDVPAKK